MTHTPKICFVTDPNLLGPTLVSLWSLLKHVSRASEIHFWGNGLSESDWTAVGHVMATRPDSALHRLDLSQTEMEGAIGPSASQYVSAATMGRLLIPRKLSGRVLYIDGDTIINGDVSPLFDLDMKHMPIGAVRDLGKIRIAARGDRGNPKIQDEAAYCKNLLGKEAVGDYVNAGVLLLDTDGIRSNPKLHSSMEDIRQASTYPLGDQDHLNRVFCDRILYLNPAWNASWGRSSRQRSLARKIGGNAGETLALAPVIIHFHGPKKPWQKARPDLWSARGRANFHYRRRMRKFLKDFPDISL